MVCYIHFLFISLSVYVCMCLHTRVLVGWMHPKAHMWRSEDNSEELVLSFCNVCPGDQIQVLRRGTFSC